jgi:hypothetical protein
MARRAPRGKAAPATSVSVAALTERLAAEEDGGPAERLVRALVAEALTEPLESLVSPLPLAELGVQLARAMIAPDDPGRAVVVQHIVAAWECEQQRAVVTGETARPAVPPDFLVRALALRPDLQRLPKGIGDGIVDPADVRAILGLALADTLDEMLGRLPLAAGGRGLLGSFARGASKGAGGLLGMLGTGLREQIRGMAGPAAQIFKERLAHRVRTPEGQKALAETIRRALDRVLDTPLAELYAVAEPTLVASAVVLALDVLSHNLARPSVAAAVAVQWEQLVARLAAVPMGDLLDHLGVRERVVASVVEWGASRIRAFARTAAFHEWLESWLAPAP